MELEIFRAGNYGEKGTWTPEDLKEIVETSNANNIEAPIVVGHSSSDKDPCHGVLGKLRLAGDTIMAPVKRITGALKDAFNKGEYPNWSAEIYPDLHGTGKKALRRLAFLGATPPEVKGLKAYGTFSDTDKYTTVNFSDMKVIDTEVIREDEKENKSGKEDDMPKEMTAEEKKALEAKQKELEEQQEENRKLKEQNEKILKQMEEQKKVEIDEKVKVFSDEMKGKIPAGKIPGAAAIFRDLLKNDSVHTFSDASGKQVSSPMAHMFSDLFKDVQKKVSTTNFSDQDEDGDEQGDAYSRAMESRYGKE